MIDFAAEQRALARRCWHFIAPREMWPVPDAWLRRTLFGQDIFIQRFGDELRGYLNVCQHRGFPLRTSDSGVGSVTCGFHGWQYNKDGIPTGVPRNTELFGLSKEQKAELALPEVRVESVGRFVFAALSPEAPSLEEFLGPIADVYRAVDTSVEPMFDHGSVIVEANWKLHVEITLDDYHAAMIHPNSFGAKGPLYVDGHVYTQHGLHSSYLWRKDPHWDFAPWWDSIRRGINIHDGYKIFNLFPSSLLASSRPAAYASVDTPLSPTRTRVDYFQWDWTDSKSSEEVLDAFRKFGIELNREDGGACEQWQQTVDALAHPPVIGALERRVDMFRASYREVVG